MNIGDRLRELRKERRLTQNDVETLTGIKRSSLALYELGVQTPPIDKLIKLAYLYNVSLDYLCGIDNRTVRTKSSKSEI